VKFCADFVQRGLREIDQQKTDHQLRVWDGMPQVVGGLSVWPVACSVHGNDAA
jgi:hypothetical protein